MTPLLSELTRNLAELSASFARIAAIQIEAFVPVDEPVLVDEFVEIEGVTHV